jgi:hypothetical protein
MDELASTRETNAPTQELRMAGINIEPRPLKVLSVRTIKVEFPYKQEEIIHISDPLHETERLRTELTLSTQFYRSSHDKHIEQQLFLKLSEADSVRHD